MPSLCGCQVLCNRCLLGAHASIPKAFGQAPLGRMETATFSTTNHGFHDLLGFAGRSSSTKTPALARLGFPGVRSGPLIQLGFGGAHSRRRKTGPLAQLRFPKKCDGEDGPLLQLGLAEKFNRRNRHPLLLGFAEKLNHRNGLLRFAEKHSKQDQPRPNLGFLGPLEFAGGCIRRSSTPLLQLGFLSLCSRANKPFLGVGDNVCARGKSVGYSHSSWSARPHQWLQLPSRIMSVSCRGRSGDFSADEFGPYPWDPSWHIPDNNAIEWIQEDIVTLFTSDGLIQTGGSLIPHKKKQFHGKAPFRYRRFREEDNYMNPKQDLCLGAIFDIVATNGLDMGRRFCVFGFCRSIEMLSDVVEDTVLEQGGEVVRAAKGNSGGLNEKLSMTVAVPLLWGVPPAVDSLNYAIRCGGGIVEKVSCQWEFL